MRPPVTMPLDEMMTDGIVVALILFDSSGVDAKVKPGHCRGEPYLRIISTRLVAVFLVVLQKYFDCLDRHRAVAENRHAGNLPRLDQMLEYEYEFLRALDGKCREQSTLPPRFAVAVINVASSGSGSSLG